MKPPAFSISPAETSSATPLIALNAVCIDTETTGLDTAKARIIQIGGIRIRKGQADEHDTFERLINPGANIPAESSAIHGIYDRDVAGAGSFAEVGLIFEDWASGSVIVGYSIGFDLAMMKREHEIAGFRWQPPRSMDVRHLAQLAAPELPDYSLDTVAKWLEIEIHNRHSAFGDALATAEIFTALVPKLSDRGIRTIAEAERGSKRFSEQTTSEAQAGWQDAVRSSQFDQSIAALARIDSFPYRHKAADIMRAPPAFVDSTEPLGSVLSILMERKISSVFVNGSAASRGEGILTERDVLRALNEHGADAFDLTAGDIAQFPLQSVASGAYLYRAMGIMNRKGFRHLGVRSKDGKIVGALSARDLLRQRGDDAISLNDQIEEAGTAHDLGLVWANLALVAQGLVSEEVDVRDIAAVISREMCALTRRAAQIAEAEMADAGRGEPPVPYALLVLGSGGRGESLLAMDQDNAIVYEHGEEGGPQDLWFAELGKRVADILHLAGVPYCKGGVMASNRAWRMSLGDWKANVVAWISRHTPEDILNTDIFFDAVCVHGDDRLAQDVLQTAFAAGANSREFLQLMSVNAANVPDTIGWFGRIRLVEGRIDLKKGGIMPVFSAARIVAIRHGVRDRATPERLAAVTGKVDTPASVIESLIEAHRVLLGLILDQQLRDLDEGISLSNKVAANDLTVIKRDRLKWALAQVRSVSNLLGDPVTSI